MRERQQHQSSRRFSTKLRGISMRWFRI
ncbi:DEBR0S1_16336g1_1 [Brettanomyces bruxellensis]|uniref:DEBR0S1_16336g1_1 n=1 Tax=Dekkera bruxellensis TaxID=5007 RepID=A0A7D9CV80_DEKBR|nr:DEBR0S1_16336g1_1 [Brettanomyces bruxellensis]